MSFTYSDNGRTWRLWTDKDGVVHDEPVDPPAAPQPLEPSDG